jgi:hypothetical protein
MAALGVWLRHMGPFLAQSVSLRSVRPRPELGVKPTSRLRARSSEFDPKRTSTGYCSAAISRSTRAYNAPDISLIEVSSRDVARTVF